MARYNRKNPSAKNFGLQSRDMEKAAKNALREDMLSKSSISTMTARFSKFTRFVKTTWGIKDLRELRLSHVMSYADDLREKCKHGDLRASTAQNYLSAVNRVMEIARGDRHLYVAPVQQADMPKRSGVCLRSRATSPEVLAASIRLVPERLVAQIELQRLWGLRFEESCKANAHALLKQAIDKRAITVTDGTKGGRPRDIPVVAEEQIRVLKCAAAIQGSCKSMIPVHLSYKAYKNECYEAIRITPMRGFHGNRHAYAQSRYREIVGCECPVAAGVKHGIKHYQYIAEKLEIDKPQAKSVDEEARQQIAAELGHGRSEVTNSYLG